jgi:CarboxypepD_reg-like domain
MVTMRIERPATSLLATAVLLGAASQTAGAQTPRALSAIDGAVSDTSLAPLADATASILGSTVHVATDASGRFRILALPAGQYIIVVRRLGYVPVSAVLQVAERDTIRMSFTLRRLVTELDTVVVSAQWRSMRLAEFEEHRKFGQGQFMTQAQIEARNSVDISDLLRTFMSVNVPSAGPVTNRRAGISMTCPFKYFIDGVSIPTPKNPDTDLPSPKVLAGIEVYANTATIPLQYKTSGGDNIFRYGGAFCGVILLWTRDGS